MSNRFHNKLHRQNHHSNPTSGYPDSALDPIASFEQPFQGEFYSQGDIITTQNLSAGINLTVGNDGIIQNNLTVKGNLNVLGTTTQLDTLVYATSALSVTNSGMGPAATFKQTGNEPVAVFYDDNNAALYVDGKTATPGYIGIGTNVPGAKLTVSGTISSSSTVEFPNIGTGTDNSVVILNSGGFLKTDEINPAVWDTTAKYVSASNGALTVNRLTKAVNSTGINESIVTDDGSLVSVAGNLSASGTATIGTIVDNSTNTSVVVQTAGLLQKRTLNAAAFDTASKYVSASDGTLTVNYLTKAIDSNGINESIVYDDGTNVGIGETSPEGKLHVKSGSAGSVTAQPNSIGVFESSSNAYVSILSPNAQYAGVVMGGPNNPYGSYVSWNHDNSALKVATAHSQGSIQFLVNTEQEAVRILSGGNVGIGTTNPKEKLTVSGNLSASGTATIGTIATGSGTSVLIESSGLVQKRSLNAASFDTTSRFVSASDGDLTVNYLTKATNSNGINESIISDNGSLVYVGGNLTVSGNLTALGNSYFANTLFTTTSSISVVNNGPGPAMYVYQGPGTSDVASFYDGDGVEVLHIGNCDPGQQLGKIGINESDPIKELTVKGSVSASGTFNLGTINTNDSSNSFVVLGTDNILQKRTINIAATNTTSKFVSAADGALIVNRLTKATDSTGINESIVFDNGTNVGIGTDVPGAKLTVSGTLSSSSTVEFPNIGTGEDNSVVILNASGFLKTDEINPAVWDTTAKYVSASDGALTVNRLTKAENSNGIDESIVFDDGTNVGIGTDTPGAKLTVSGTLSTSGTATIGTLADSLTNTSVVVQTAGLLQKRSLNAAAFDTTSKFVSASDGNLDAGYIPVAENALGLDSSVIYQNGSNNIGIGTTSPSEKLTVSGNISASGLIIPGSATVTPTTTTALPADNDVIFNNQTGAVTITGFSSGRAGVTYTLTNKSTHEVTLSSSNDLFVRGGSTWAGYTCSSSPNGKIELPQNFSCSLRMDSATSGSVW